MRKRFFWPPLTDEPKIEYLDYFRTNYNIKKTTINPVNEAIFGREIPRPLFHAPYDIYSGGDNEFFVTEPLAGYVLTVDLESSRTEYLKTREGDPYVFKMPLGIDGFRGGEVAVVNSAKNEIVFFDRNNQFMRKFKMKRVVRPVNVAFDETRDRAYVVDPGQHKVVVASLVDGSYLSEFGGRGGEDGHFNFPVDLDLDASGNIYVLDSLNARVQVFDPEGTYLRSFGERGTALGSFAIPKGIAISPSGFVYITDSASHRIVIFDLEGNYLMTIGEKSINSDFVFPGGFYLPAGIDIDRQDGIWVIDGLNRTVHRFQYLTEEYLVRNPILPGQKADPGLEKN